MREREQLAPRIEAVLDEVDERGREQDAAEQAMISEMLAAQREQRYRDLRRQAWQSVGGPVLCGRQAAISPAESVPTGERVERWAMPGEERAPGWLAALLLLACAALGWLMLVGAWTCLRWMGLA